MGKLEDKIAAKKKVKQFGKEKIFEIEKGRSLIRIQISIYKNKSAVDIREYYENDAGEWKPTAKGIRIPFDLLPELKEAIEFFDNLTA